MSAESGNNPSPTSPSVDDMIDLLGSLHVELKSVTVNKERIKTLRKEIKERTEQLFALGLDMDDILLYESTLNGGDLLVAIGEATQPYQIHEAKKRTDELLTVVPIDRLDEIYSALYAKLLAIYGYDYNHIIGLIAESEKDSNDISALESLWHEIRRSLGAIQAINVSLSEEYHSRMWHKSSERKRSLYRLRDQRFVVSIYNQFEGARDYLSSALRAVEENIRNAHTEKLQKLNQTLRDSESQFVHAAEKYARIYLSLSTKGVTPDSLEDLNTLRGLLTGDTLPFSGNTIKDGELVHDVDVFFKQHGPILKFTQSDLNGLLQSLDYSAGTNAVGEVLKQGRRSSYITNPFFTE